jgi:protein-S-isoprenylcysteine O-methyltransferase Ste14
MNYKKLGADLPDSDRKSAFYISLCVYISFFIVYGRYLYLKQTTTISETFLPYENTFFFICLGLVLLRAWSIDILGKWFTSEVVIQKGHKLITRGPYKYLRHPSYTGAAFFWVLHSTLFAQPELIIFTSLLIIPPYLNRIRIEEKALLGEFGDGYENYKKTSKRLIPFIY